jgi:hypothetical protein
MVPGTGRENTPEMDEEDAELREAIRLSLLAANVEPSFAPTANVNPFRHFASSC